MRPGLCRSRPPWRCPACLSSTFWGFMSRVDDAAYVGRVQGLGDLRS